MTDLKPCPFCGGTDIRKGSNPLERWLYCRDCGAFGPKSPHPRDGDKREERAAWNQRHTPVPELPEGWEHGECGGERAVVGRDAPYLVSVYVDQICGQLDLCIDRVDPEVAPAKGHVNVTAPLAVIRAVLARHDRENADDS